MDTDTLASQLCHALDLLKADNNALRAELAHQKELYSRLLQDLERTSQDHETRLRALTETSTQFRLLVALSTGGGLLGVIALIRAVL